jgi:hypothetical protein
VSSARTVWEEGHEPGRRVVALGLALALTVTVLDLAVRPEDFFTVGVLPPLIMLTVFAILAVTRPGTIAHPRDGVVQAVVSGLSTHAVALGVGYGLCLACLAVRQRFVSR